MSSWQGKYVVGLTGNIATGKSVVRKMLEHLGAYGIDADALAHRVIAKEAPGYQPAVETFGKWILTPEGQIDREKLGRLVFADQDAMKQLEEIVHPHVKGAVDILIRRSRYDVIVVEAIKLIESGMAEKCDSLWVTYAPQELQLARLMQRRRMSESTARLRIAAQPPQEAKTATAMVVIRNDGSFEGTWQQVYAAWQQYIPAEKMEPPPEEAVAGEMTVIRARPHDAQQISALISQLSAGKRRLEHEDVMESFGEKAFLLLQVDGESLGLVGWQVENLVARTDDVYLNKSIPMVDGLGVILSEVERASRELQCEISLLFLPNEFQDQEAVFKELGYQQRSVKSLGVRAWEEAAMESMPPDSIMLFKQLRQDRVLRPV